MIRKFFEKDSVLKIASFLIAILIWLYVIYVEDPKIKVTIDDIPVYCKTSELSSDIALIDYNIKNVDVEIEANRSEIINFDNSEIEAYIDLSNISEAGKYDAKIKVSCINKNVSVVDCSEKKSSVQIDDVVSKAMPIGIELVGDFPSGYDMAMEPIIFLESTTLTGPKTYIDAVEQVFIQVDCERLTESKTVSSDILLLDDKNTVIDKNHEAFKHIKLSDKKASAYMTVKKNKNSDIDINDED